MPQGRRLLQVLFSSAILITKYFLSAAPLNLAGCDGAPCRAYLIDYGWGHS